MASVKNVTAWTPPSGQGYVVQQGTLNLTTNSGNQLTTNSGNSLVTSTTYNIGKFVTAWTQSGV